MSSKRSRVARLEARQAARALIVARVCPPDPRCMPEALDGLSVEELWALALEVGAIAQPGQEPQPGQRPYLDLDALNALTAPELVSLYFKGQP